MRKVAVVFLLFLSLTMFACAVPLKQINGDNPTGNVVITCEPDNAKVYLDGNYVGRAKGFADEVSALKIVIGVHVVELDLEGYQNELIEVQAKQAGEVIELKMNLRPQDPEAVKKHKKKE